MTKSSSSSSARGGGVAGSQTPRRSVTSIRCTHWRFMDKHDRHIAPCRNNAAQSHTARRGTAPHSRRDPWLLPLSDCGRNCAVGANQFCQSSAIISTVCLCTSDFGLGSGSHTARRGMAPHSRRDPCLLLLCHSVVAPSVFAGLLVLPGINPQGGAWAPRVSSASVRPHQTRDCP